MSFYSEIATEADAILAEFGAIAILRRAGFDAYDPATATTVDDSPVDEAVRAVVMDYDEAAMANSLIQRGDKRVIMSAVGVSPPRITDLFVWVDGTYTIVNPKNLAPAGESVLYELQVRK